MAACSIFDEDEVCVRISSDTYKYGLVVESSEYISSDEEDEEDENRVQKGQVKVAWHPSGDEAVVSEKKVILVDRSLMPGDVVRRLISGEESQRGFIQSCQIKCHVKILNTDHYIYNIDAKDIKPIQEYDPEPEVTLDSWVGHVMEISEEITVRFPCGARCRLSSANVLNLEDARDKRKQHTEFAMRNFYPGQELAGSYEDYEDAKWIYTSNVRGPKCKAKKLFTANVVVEEVKTESVEVNWVCKGFTRTGAGIDKLKHPPTVVEGEDLKRLRRLDCFEHCHMQLGDKGYYVVKEKDTLLYKLSPRKQIIPDILQLKAEENVTVNGISAEELTGGKGKKDSGLVNKNKENCDENEDETSKCVSNKEKSVEKDDDFEDVEDDASDSGSGTESTKSGQESPATKRKNRKRACLSGHGLKRLRGKKAKKKSHIEREVKPGDKVPVEIWYTFSSCSVMWQDGTVEDNIASPELYPIHHLDDLEYFPGDFVLNNEGTIGTDYGVVVSSDHKERTVMVKWIKPYIPGKSNKPEEREPVELSVFDVKDHPDYKFRAGHTVIRVGGYEDDKDVEAVGQVFRLDPDGTIQVWWPDNTMTSCYPQDLYIIGEEFQSESGSESEEWSDEEEEEEESDVSWETEDDESDSESDSNVKKKKSKQEWTLNDAKKQELDLLLDRAQAAVAGLLSVFETLTSPYLENLRQVYKDILAIFKRCREVEKILQSSFFDAEEITELISDIKDELRKEKTAKLAMHVAQIYKHRTSRDEGSLNTSSREAESNKTDESFKDGASLDTGAEGGKCETKEESATLERLRKALIDYGSNIEDPMLRIIFDTTYIAKITDSAQKASAKIPKSQGSSDQGYQNGAKGDSTIPVDVNSESVTDIIQNVIISVCDQENIAKELQTVLQTMRENQEIAGNTETSLTTESKTENQPGSEKSVTLAGATGKLHTGFSDKLLQTGSADKLTTESERKASANYITLCTKVCRALNVGLMLVKQEVNKRWLAYKFGYDKNMSDSEILAKMQEKMIESIDSGKGPLSLDSYSTDEDSTSRTECIKELESHEKRSSPETEASEQIVLNDSELEEEEQDVNKEEKGFEVCSEAPLSHRFRSDEEKPLSQKEFISAVRKEWNLLRTGLPDGIFVKIFEDRMDLMSVMIQGPMHTPYQDGLFAFDILLPANYPHTPPIFHYHSFCNERLNPNLYEDGKVCVSLLGTWTGKGSELWTVGSSVLQVLVSIQGLILVPEPYFNEAGYEKQRGSQHGQENSRMYNEMAILKLVQSMTKMAETPPAVFVEETKAHLRKHALRMIHRIEKWVEISNQSRLATSSATHRVCNGDAPEASRKADAVIPAEKPDQADTTSCSNTIVEPVLEGEITLKGSKENTCAEKPDFPLLPASKGFCIAIGKHLECFKRVLKDHVFHQEPGVM